MPHTKTIAAALHEHSALRPRCRCSAPLDYATDTNVCAACSRRLHLGLDPLTEQQRREITRRDRRYKRAKERA